MDERLRPDSFFQEIRTMYAASRVGNFQEALAILNCRPLATWAITRRFLSNNPARSPSFYVCAMKKAGYVMQYGTKTTHDHALAWLEANTGFRSSWAYRRTRKAVAA
jgi:hypothetical protein